MLLHSLNEMTLGTFNGQGLQSYHQTVCEDVQEKIDIECARSASAHAAYHVGSSIGSLR